MRPGGRALARADGLGADVADVRVVGDPAGGGAGHPHLVLGARHQVVANAFQRFTVVHGLPACEKEFKHISLVIRN